MDFQTSIRTCLNKYADFSGRASRSEYWWFMLFYILAYLALAIVAAILHFPLLVILILGLVVPGISAAARRLHDTGKTGWWQLISIIPLIGLVLIVFLAQEGTAEGEKYGAAPAI